MKILVVTAALIIIAVALAGTSARGQNESTINITATAYATYRQGVHQVRQYLLYNRSLGPTPIGNAVLLCNTIGRDTGPFRKLAAFCQGTYTIAHNGSVQVSGVARAPFQYQFALTGGTGQYQGIGGQLTVTVYSQKPRRELLKFVYAP